MIFSLHFDATLSDIGKMRIYIPNPKSLSFVFLNLHVDFRPTQTCVHILSCFLNRKRALITLVHLPPKQSTLSKSKLVSDIENIWDSFGINMMLQFEVYFKKRLSQFDNFILGDRSFPNDFFKRLLLLPLLLQLLPRPIKIFIRILTFYKSKIVSKKVSKIISSTSHYACLVSFGRCFGGRLGFAFLFTQNPIGLFLKNSY